jgi:hypothetical protein
MIDIIRGTQGSYPDVRVLGKEFKPVVKLVEQAARINEEGRKAGQRELELTQEVQYQERKHEDDRTRALRNGEAAPSEREINRAKRALRKYFSVCKLHIAPLWRRKRRRRQI